MGILEDLHKKVAIGFLPEDGQNQQKYFTQLTQAQANLKGFFRKSGVQFSDFFNSVRAIPKHADLALEILTLKDEVSCTSNTSFHATARLLYLINLFEKTSSSFLKAGGNISKTLYFENMLTAQQLAVLFDNLDKMACELNEDHDLTIEYIGTDSLTIILGGIAGLVLIQILANTADSALRGYFKDKASAKAIDSAIESCEKINNSDLTDEQKKKLEGHAYKVLDQQTDFIVNNKPFNIKELVEAGRKLGGFLLGDGSGNA